MSAASRANGRPAQAGLEAAGIRDFEHGIAAVDTHFMRANLDASHLIVHRGRAAFVDTGSTHAVPHLLAALQLKGVAPEDVDFVFLTHIHLDHAGGAGALVAALPNARVAVHPRGAGHLVDPSKLIAATRQVYGDAAYAQLYGEIRPIAPERLIVTDDAAELALAGRRFSFLHTPGHALHHQVIHDLEAAAVFSGDTFGVSYRELDVDGREFILPATTPTQFDPDQLHGSIDRVLGCQPRAVYLTHYSEVTDVERLGADMHAGVRAYVEFAERHAATADAAPAIARDMAAWLWQRLDAHGFVADDARRTAILAQDIELNAQGVATWLARRRH